MLEDGIAGLESHMYRDLLGWQHRIADSSQGPLPNDPRQLDLNSGIVNDLDRVQLFARAAADSRSLEWLARRGHLMNLFTQRAATRAWVTNLQSRSDLFSPS